VLRRAPDGLPYRWQRLKESAGDEFLDDMVWALPRVGTTFEKVAGRFAGQEKDVLFLEVNCDEDETLWDRTWWKRSPKTSVLFADGLDLLLGVNSFPTTLVLDRTGKIAYRGEEWTWRSGGEFGGGD